MSYKILETDEAIKDLFTIAKNAFDYTGERDSGEKVFIAYDNVAISLGEFPQKFRGISIEHRNYEIHVRAFGNYNMFFYVNESTNEVIILHILYQKQNWDYILRYENSYHIDGLIL